MTELAYYLGPWHWATDDTVSYWRAPAGTRGLVDLRGLPDQSLGGRLGERPHGFFGVDPAARPGSDYALLGRGDCRDIAVTAAMQDAWAALLGYRPQGERLVDLLWDHLTNGSDPSGDEPVMPLMPGVDLTLKLHLGGHSLVKSARFNVLDSTPHADRVRTLLQRQYAANLERLGDHANRVLDYWCEKYRLNKGNRSQWGRLVPPNLRRDARLLPHQTTIADTFARSDNTDLNASDTGKTLDGSAGTWQWSEEEGDHAIESEQLRCTSGGGSVRAEHDLSSDDHYSQVDVYVYAGNQTAGVGPNARFASAALTYYQMRSRNQTTGRFRLFKRVSGTFTQIGSTPSDANPGHPFTLKVQADGSTISAYVNDAQWFAETDTAISGNLRSGVDGAFLTTGTLLDNFEAADLAAAGNRRRRVLLAAG